MTWKGYAIKAKLANLDLLVAECTRRATWRVPRYATPGNLGDATGHSGRQSHEDQVTALLTLDAAKALVKLGDEPGFHLWQHPLFDPILVRITSVDLPVSPGVDGYFWATLSLIEHREPDQELFLYPRSPASAQGAAKAAFGGLDDDLDGLGAGIPGAKGEALADAAGAFGDSFGEWSDAFDAVEDGGSTWRDMSRALDGLASAADDLITALEDVEDDIGALVDSCTRGALTVVEAARDAVGALESVADATVVFATTSPTSLYQLMTEAGLTVTDDLLISIMEASDIADPLAIPPGSLVSLPRGAR